MNFGNWKWRGNKGWNGTQAIGSGEAMKDLFVV